MEDRDLVSLMLAKFEMLGSKTHCTCDGDCWAGSCKGCQERVIDANEYEKAMTDIYAAVEENR